MNISIFSNMYACAGEKGEVISFEELMYRKYNTGLSKKAKFYQPVIQCNNCGEFLVKKDVLSYKFYEYWEGCVFVDIDDPKYYDENIKDYRVCEWWTEELINEKLKSLSEQLIKYKWYKFSCLSTSGKGYHILGYIKAKWKTENEYMATYIQVYTDIYNELIKLFKDYNEKEVESMLDDHNLYPWQKFVVGGRIGYHNDCFDEDTTYDLNNYENDDIYLMQMKEIGNDWIVNKVISKFEAIQKSRIGGEVIEKKYRGIEYQKGSLKPLIKSGKVQYFNNMYRYMLVKTLKMFYDKEEAREISKRIYDDYWVPGHDKQAAYTHIDQLIGDTSYFEPKDWFINILVDIGVIDKRPLWDHYFDMDEMNVNYLSGIMGKILNLSTNLTIIESPASSGKTTAIAKMRESLWMVEPYNPIIKNNFVGKTDEFQCIYDDGKFEQDKFNKVCNKVVSSYNKLLSIDYSVFKDNNIKYLFIDESHIIFADCKFRFNIMIKLVQKVIELIKFAGVKVIMMSGTPLKEKELFSIDEEIDITYIKVKREHKYNKNLIVKTYKMFNDKILTKSGKYKSTGFVLSDYIINDIENYIKKGYKILIPFNDGDKKIKELMMRLDVKFPYLKIDDDFNIYKRQYRFDEKNKELSENGNMIPNIVFATKYLSVGVSIYNKDKAVILFIGTKFPAYEIEQYACRFRNVDLECVWYVNEIKDDENIFEYKLIEYPSEEEIKTVIETTEKELKHRGWENWDSILNDVLNKYQGIIKENVFELNKLYYDKWTLNLSWIIRSLDNYYSSFGNNINDLEKKYGFNIIKEDITSKTNLSYQDEYKEKLKDYYNEQCKIMLDWINNIDECYLLNGRLEYKDYNLNIEPFISMNNFAKFCWFHYISVNNIKQMLLSCITVEYNIDYNSIKVKNIISKIEHAKKSIENAKSLPDTNKHKKSQLKNAIEKLDKSEKELEACKYENISKSKYSLRILEGYKKLIMMMSHKEYDMSKLFKFTVKYVRDNYVRNDNRMLNKEDILSDIYNKWIKVMSDSNIEFEYYKNSVKESIDKMIQLLFSTFETCGMIYIQDSKFSHFDVKWFDTDYERMNNNINIEKFAYNGLVKLTE